jgi:CarboxypepD_reg-like domain/TonB-dependent Receptor Plug Domain
MKPVQVLFAIVILVGAAESAQAQQVQGLGKPLARDTVRRGMGVIDGVVSDTNLVPLAGSEVGILRTSLKVHTGENGRFRILGVPEGVYILIVRRLGFRPVSAMVEVPRGDTLRLAYALERAPVGLDTVVITEKRESVRLMEFNYRRKVGQGEFITAADIEKRPSVMAADVLRLSKTIDVSPSYSKGSMAEYYAVSRRGGDVMQGSCPMQIFVDGVPMPSPFDLNLLPPPKEFAAIEIYAGAASVPPQFGGVSRRCGVILFWTKQG